MSRYPPAWVSVRETSALKVFKLRAISSTGFEGKLTKVCLRMSPSISMSVIFNFKEWIIFNFLTNYYLNSTIINRG
mgnify:CR=1 FL=1